jgi:CDP-diacylglycerol--glycerol-3-phosphate 3-phosphatidyltransferase
MPPDQSTSADAKPPAQDQFFNVPNQITLLRLILAIVVFVLLPLGFHLPALIVFIIAASTDWVDGYWARKYGQVTQLGRIFDPFVDKFIICGTFIFLVAERSSGIHAWVAVLVTMREMGVTVIRSFLEQQGKDFSAKWAGKWKMVFQCVTAAVAIWALYLVGHEGYEVVTTWYGAKGTPVWLITILCSLVWLTVVLTVYSGAGYVFRALRLLRE